MSIDKEIVIKTKLLDFPVYMTVKNYQIYTNLCMVRNKLIENGIISKELRYKMYFYKKINGNLIKIKEGDILERTIYLNIEDDLDYSEPVNILFYLQKRMIDFEYKFQELYKNYKQETENNIDNIKILKNMWIKFKEINNDCFDYAEWYIIIKPIKNINLLYKMAIDIRKWLIHKEKIISDIDLEILNKTEYTENENDYDIIQKFL
jgi:hypothetical protein